MPPPLGQLRSLAACAPRPPAAHPLQDGKDIRSTGGVKFRYGAFHAAGTGLAE